MEKITFQKHEPGYYSLQFPGEEKKYLNEIELTQLKELLSPEWVDVKERKPMEGQICLVWHEKLDKHQIVPYYDEIGFCSVFINKWMPVAPLPTI